jgi:hypothetical protein
MGFFTDIKRKAKLADKQEVRFEQFLTKEEKLLHLFSNVDRLPLAEVLEETGIDTLGSLKTHIYNLRKAKQLYLRTKFNFVEKVERKKRKAKRAKA